MNFHERGITEDEVDITSRGKKKASATRPVEKPFLKQEYICEIALSSDNGINFHGSRAVMMYKWSLLSD